MRWSRARPQREAGTEPPTAKLLSESQFRRHLLAAFLESGINVNPHRLSPRSDRHACAEHDACRRTLEFDRSQNFPFPIRQSLERCAGSLAILGDRRRYSQRHSTSNNYRTDVVLNHKARSGGSYLMLWVG